MKLILTKDQIALSNKIERFYSNLYDASIQSSLQGKEKFLEDELIKFPNDLHKFIKLYLSDDYTSSEILVLYISR